MFESVLNPILGPLLGLEPLISIGIISFIIALLITLTYKYFTNQVEMKRLKDEMKAHQKEMKEHKQDPKKMMEIQKKTMEKNMQYMMHSMKAMIVTMLPLLLIFGWLNAHLAYEPINPGEEFTTTAFFKEGVSGIVFLDVPAELEIIGYAEQEIVEGKAEWTLKGPKGEYLLEYTLDDNSETKEILITEERNYKTPEKRIKKNPEFEKIKINQEPIKPLNLFGWRVGWIGAYIIFSLVFSMGLRKIIKVY